MVDAECNQQLLLVVVDKLLLGGIIGIFVFFANRMLEQYKTNQKLREYIAKKRFEQLEPFWEKMDGIRNEVTIVYLRSMGSIGSNLSEEDLLQPFNDLNEKINKVHKDIRNTRFWLGKRLWLQHNTHMHNLGALVDDIKKQTSDLHSGARLDKEQLEEIKKRVQDENNTRLYIEDIIRLT